MSSTDNIAERVLGYNPNTIVAAAAAAIIGNVGMGLMYRLYKSRAWWGLCLPIGCFIEALGFGLRYMAKYKPDSLALFAISGLFIVCAPASFLAFNYITYGRLISYVGSEHSIVNPRKVAVAFVISDVFTFLLQAGGSGLQTSEKTANTGQKVVLVGLALQAVSYGLFCILLAKSHISIKSAWGLRPQKPCIKLIWVLYFSSAFITIRCIYRVAEYAQGQGGYLLTHEVFVYLLDTLPLLFATGVYIIFWPTTYIEGGDKNSKESVEMSGGLIP